MIYPDDYKCLICKKKYYGCKREWKRNGLLSCSSFVHGNIVRGTYPVHLGLFRCLYGVCPQKLLKLWL